jgi:hypothetical protein
MTLEAYAKARKDFRARVIAHKKARTVHLGEHVTLLFEDELTVRYQVQEMLRIEKIFEEAGIRDEIEAYNPLIPDGRNFKATMLIEYEDEAERRAALAKMKGIEDRVWVRVEAARVGAIADEDLSARTKSDVVGPLFASIRRDGRRAEVRDVARRRHRLPALPGAHRRPARLPRESLLKDLR